MVEDYAHYAKISEHIIVLMKRPQFIHWQSKNQQQVSMMLNNKAEVEDYVSTRHKIDCTVDTVPLLMNYRSTEEGKKRERCRSLCLSIQLREGTRREKREDRRRRPD